MRIPFPTLLATTLVSSSALAQTRAPEAASSPSDAPPAPPAPGLSSSPAPPPPPAAPAFGLAEGQGELRAGWNEGFYIRDSKDRLVLYPRGRLHLDFHSFFGKGTSGDDALPAAGGGSALKARLFVRRLRLEMSGELMQRLAFTFGVDFGGQPITNANGKTQTAAAPAGEAPSVESARFASVQSPAAVATLANAFVNYRLCPCFNLMLGQHQAPVGIENRTSNNAHPFIERNLPIRGFVVPNSKEIGLVAWGDLGGTIVSYELGVFAGDGQNRPQVDNDVDFIGRVFTRPLSNGKGPLAKLQLGASGRHGRRDQNDVGYDYPAITTGQGFTLWSPVYTDSRGRRTHVIPSGDQDLVGGELRVPIGRFELRGEGYWVVNETREAIEGFQLTHTERLGRLTGAGFYASLSAWPWGDAFVTGDPGFSRPMRLDLTKKPRFARGLELVAIVGGIRAEYDGAAREGSADAKTPVGADITAYQYGFGANYWYTRQIRASVNYTLYHTPGSSEGRNLATVPANELEEPADGELLHELGTRIGLFF